LYSQYLHSAVTFYDPVIFPQLQGMGVSLSLSFPPVLLLCLSDLLSLLVEGAIGLSPFFSFFFSINSPHTLDSLHPPLVLPSASPMVIGVSLRFFHFSPRPPAVSEVSAAVPLWLIPHTSRYPFLASLCRSSLPLAGTLPPPSEAHKSWPDTASIIFVLRVISSC